MKEEGKTLGVAKISTKAQVTIPEGAREAFALKIGDYLAFIKKGNELIVRKA